MTESQLTIFRESLRCLPFNGISIKNFSKQINVNPHTIYNYISGQTPSEKNYRYITYIIEKHFPAARAQAKEITEVF